MKGSGSEGSETKPGGETSHRQEELGREKCQVFSCWPESVRIEYPLRGGSAWATFFVSNTTSSPERLLLKEPTTQYFQLDYQPTRLIYPGCKMEVKVIVRPKGERREILDEVRVVCRHSCFTRVTLKAIPVHENLQQIPTNVNLGLVPIGQSATYKITLTPIGEAMPFLIINPVCNPDFIIYPLKGEVLEDPVEIFFKYSPKAYITLCIPIHLYLPKLLSIPYMITVVAESKPGALRDKLLKSVEVKEEKLEEPVSEKVTEQVKPHLPVTNNIPNWSHHLTNLFLNSKVDKKRSSNELAGPLGFYVDEEMSIKASMEKEFREKAKECMKENVTALNASYKVKLIKDCCNVEERERHWREYQDHLDHIPWNQMIREKHIRQRTIKGPETSYNFTFTEEAADPWYCRYMDMDRFIEAGRKIIILNRLLKRLRTLKDVTAEDITLFSISSVYDL